MAAPAIRASACRGVSGTFILFRYSPTACVSAVGIGSQGYGYVVVEVPGVVRMAYPMSTPNAMTNRTASTATAAEIPRLFESAGNFPSRARTR